MKLFQRIMILPVFLLAAGLLYGQNTTYNLPPGYRLNPNQTIFDLSYKLGGKKIDKNYSSKQLEILKQIDDTELKSTSPEYQQYIKEGRNFIKSLSKKVRSIYSDEEIWYIYAFDKELKQRIQNMK